MFICLCLCCFLFSISWWERTGLNTYLHNFKTILCDLPCQFPKFNDYFTFPFVIETPKLIVSLFERWNLGMMRMWPKLFSISSFMFPSFSSCFTFYTTCLWYHLLTDQTLRILYHVHGSTLATSLYWLCHPLYIMSRQVELI